MLSDLYDELAVISNAAEAAEFALARLGVHGGDDVVDFLVQTFRKEGAPPARTCIRDALLATGVGLIDGNDWDPASMRALNKRAESAGGYSLATVRSGVRIGSDLIRKQEVFFNTEDADSKLE